jgi:hypothetical protein
MMFNPDLYRLLLLDNEGRRYLYTVRLSPIPDEAAAAMSKFFKETRAWHVKITTYGHEVVYEDSRPRLFTYEQTLAIGKVIAMRKTADAALVRTEVAALKERGIDFEFDAYETKEDVFVDFWVSRLFQLRWNELPFNVRRGYIDCSNGTITEEQLWAKHDGAEHSSWWLDL